MNKTRHKLRSFKCQSVGPERKTVTRRIDLDMKIPFQLEVGITLSQGPATPSKLLDLPFVHICTERRHLLKSIQLFLHNPAN